jgi:CDP-glucose 4,6-dehydratase
VAPDLGKLIMNEQFWNGKRVLVTGHTGFKGGWLSLWLADLGAIVTGLGLPPTEPESFFKAVELESHVESLIVDVNDATSLEQAVTTAQPQVVFHLAAQALVRASYTDPVGTFMTNIMGVVNLLDAVRRTPSVEAVLIVTSDKAYENKEWVWGYRETDELGGRDPYSASKGCAEMVTRSMKMSFFQPFVSDGHPARIGTVRAGNVIGGGDWSADRLVPDIVRGCLGPTSEVRLRNPYSVRPWQHVLDPLAAYLRLAELMVERSDGADDVWNIGPDPGDNRTVIDVAQTFVDRLGRGRIVVDDVPQGAHEATLLTLDCTKAKTRLGWRSRLSLDEAVALTADWYTAWLGGAAMLDATRVQLAAFRARGRPVQT